MAYKTRSYGYTTEEMMMPPDQRRIEHSKRLKRESEVTEMRSFKRGGSVTETGPAVLHKGERVLTRRQNRKYSRASGRR